MTTTAETISRIEKQILRSNATICRHIENLDVSGRGTVSQDILLNLRTFVEHTMFRIYAQDNDSIYDYQHTPLAINFVKTKGQLKFLSRFHAYLQIVASHYTLDPEDSERVMLKYYEFMLKIKNYLKPQYNLDVLANLDRFPLNTDKNLQEYYEKIAEKLVCRNHRADMDSSVNARYYINKVKPFFVNQQIYYEVTFVPATERASKFDRTIAFTTIDISKYYAVKLWTVEDDITILGKTMPIFIVVNWEVAIRPVEIEKFSHIFGKSIKGYSGSAEGRGLMKFLSQTGFNLVDLMTFDDTHYQKIRSKVLNAFNAKSSHLFDLFDRCRKIIGGNHPGSNVLRYLLYHMSNKVISDQIGDENERLSGLRLQYGCIHLTKCHLAHLYCTTIHDLEICLIASTQQTEYTRYLHDMCL